MAERDHGTEQAQDIGEGAMKTAHRILEDARREFKTPEKLAEHLRKLRDAQPDRSLYRHDIEGALREMMDSALGRARIARRKRRRVLVA